MKKTNEYCRPYKKVTFNENPYTGEKMVFYPNTMYRCEFISDGHRWCVYLGKGYLYFSSEEFRNYFEYGTWLSYSKALALGIDPDILRREL